MPDHHDRKRIIRKATLEAVTERDKLSDQATQEIVDVYDDAGEVIAQQIRAAAGSGDRPKIEHLQRILASVREELDQLDQKRTGILYRSIEKSTTIGVHPFASTLPESQIFAVNHAAVRFVKTFVHEDGLALSDRLWRLRQGDMDTIGGHIQQAIINGESVQHAMLRAIAAGEEIPPHIAKAAAASKTGALCKSITDLMTGAPDPATGRGIVYQAERLFRTELVRAHGEAYMGAAFAHPDIAGVKFMLSPLHRVHDICDTHASADKYGLGPGVYPTRSACPWPAHPNTRSYVEPVFRDEIGSNTEPSPSKPAEPPTKQPEKPVQTSKPSRLRGVEELIKAGASINNRLLQAGDVSGFTARLQAELNLVRSTATPAAVKGRGEGADLVRQASCLYPDDWTKYSDKAGTLSARLSHSRGYCRSYTNGDAEIVTDNFSTAVHEFAHRLQYTVPGLDDLFQDLHHRRTAGDRKERLRDLTNLDYKRDEVTQKDHYTDPYQGKIYTGWGAGKYGALEVITMAMEDAMGGKTRRLERMINADREMLDLVTGALFHYVP